MASTITDGSMLYERRPVKTHRYQWPGVQLNIWILIMLVASCFLIGSFAIFIQVQEQLLLPIPWYFPYLVTVASLTLVYIILLLYLIFNRRLLPAIVMIGAFVLFVLWMVGLVVVAVQLFGPSGSIQGSCDVAVFSFNPKGTNLQTLAWLQQRTVCQTWQAAFAFCIVGALFLVWIMVMAYQVFVTA
ncbi:hypothetical protein ACRALDRAFT_2029129 [Sodiomyces alcalophilus JCM 7366]|uniref:uncharacterized protein n=1 Tax=Sodiomyces alcalophilus JCM 7366 TaxID=591952 RepID=UPI0039B6369D